jgi:hypothetical protein
MKILSTASAVAALITATAAQAQDAGKAFECNLPYREAMMAMASLDVLSQSQVKGFIGLNGDGEKIEFAPGDTLVYGVKPKSLNLKVLPPHPVMNIKEQYTVEFTAVIAPVTADDDAVRQSVPWLVGCGEWSETCYRAEKETPQGAGLLRYVRTGDNPELQCKFTFTPKEFEALGD